MRRDCRERQRHTHAGLGCKWNATCAAVFIVSNAGARATGAATPTSRGRVDARGGRRGPRRARPLQYGNLASWRIPSLASRLHPQPACQRKRLHLPNVVQRAAPTVASARVADGVRLIRMSTGAASPGSSAHMPLISASARCQSPSSASSSGKARRPRRSSAATNRAGLRQAPWQGLSGAPAPAAGSRGCLPQSRTRRAPRIGARAHGTRE